MWSGQLDGAEVRTGKGKGVLTETKVAGRKVRVKTATVFIAELSWRTISLIRKLAWLSCWVTMLNA